MEKTFWETKIIFKETLKMLDRQKINIEQKKLADWSIDEMELCFTLFWIYCQSINGETKTSEQAIEWIKSLEDMDIFIWIQEHMTNNMLWIVDQKKKKTENMNSKS